MRTPHHPLQFNRMSKILLGERVVKLVGPADQMLGTAFRAHRPDLLLTARHTVANHDGSGSPILALEPARNFHAAITDILYPDATSDLAALFLEHGGGMNAECFAVGVPPQVTAAVGAAGGRPAIVGQGVGSFGFPELVESSSPRYMHGHIQRLFRHRDVKRSLDYEAYELGFPAFPGQSGSPVFLDGLGDSAVAVVTKGIRYGSKVGRDLAAEASWAIGITLEPYVDWIRSL